MLLPFLVAALIVLAPHLYRRLVHARFKQYAIFPQAPPSLLLGHLKKIDEFIKAGKDRGHPGKLCLASWTAASRIGEVALLYTVAHSLWQDLAFVAMNKSLNSPPLMFVDLRPVGTPLVIVRSHQVAEQISRASKSLPHSPPKMPQVYGHMAHLVGSGSILGAAGDDWKSLRRRFNPGFASQHLLKLLPCVVDKSLLFINQLDNAANTGDSFSLVRLSGNLIFDVITSVIMDHDFGAQSLGRASHFMSAYHELIETYANEQVDIPWYFTPMTEWKRRNLAKGVRKELKSIIQHAFTDRIEGDVRPLSVLHLSLRNIDTLTPQILEDTCDQLSTFLFAGHDTTSILLSWMFYELSRTPHAIQALRNELDQVFGPNPNPIRIRYMLLGDGSQELLNGMTYASAVIKETLRLWPPAGTARRISPGTGLKLELPVGEFPLDGLDVYNCAILIQRDPDVYGDTADEFVPERWLGEAASHIPASAWRPFERGPRNCIGQELVSIEAKVVIALVARRYDFTKVGLGEVALDKLGQPITGPNGSYLVNSEMYPDLDTAGNPQAG
ncbi:putative sterigmatocystin biosynthesis P450 monooxygenase stcS [Paramyrothecium foliicola]|nr:putative sterigmatocystin biosynthesis P450 monooxygenase stcS [Paramyrothecium foliicola]